VTLNAPEGLRSIPARVGRFDRPEEAADAELRLDIALTIVLEDAAELDVHHVSSLTAIPAGTCHV
jgi:hypothetical protein